VFSGRVYERVNTYVFIFRLNTGSDGNNKMKGVPDTRPRDWKRAITDRRMLRSRNDKSRRVRWSEPPSRIVISNATEYSSDVRWCIAGLTGKSEPCLTYSLLSGTRNQWRSRSNGVTRSYFSAECRLSVARQRVAQTELAWATCGADRRESYARNRDASTPWKRRVTGKQVSSPIDECCELVAR